MILGTIKALDGAKGVRVRIDGEESNSTKKYSYLSSYVPATNDRVLIEEVNGSYVILGKICTKYAECGIVREAATATTAAECTGNAATATSAAECTGNAASATTAETCTGNAATSNVSDQTKGFTNDVLSINGQLVTYVQTQYITSLPATVVTGVTTSQNKAFIHK